MARHILNSRLWFPPVSDASPEGLLAMGGDLQIPRILMAYQKGIFPWYQGDVPLWWSPDPRQVIFPENFKVSKSLRQLLRRNAFEFATNKAFADVIKACRYQPRLGQNGTWITPGIQSSFIQLHEMGIAHSAEAWKDGKLVGGLYGIRLGNIFFGESMFSLESNASKYAFTRYVEQLRSEHIRLIDCQVHSPHLESLGATIIRRSKFCEILTEEIPDSLFAG